MKNGNLHTDNNISQKKNLSCYQLHVLSSKNENEVKSTFRCGQCLQSFETLVAKKKHEKFYHFFSKPFVCECGQQFGKLCELNYHVRRVHNKEKNYVCNECKKAFFNNSDLVIHQSIHESTAKFICEDCGRRFKHVSNLIRHSRTHSGIKPYLCLPCNKRFSQIAALRQHEITEKHKVATSNIKKDNAEGDKNKELENSFDQSNGKSGSDSSSDSKGGKRKWWFYCTVCGERFPFSVLLRDHETKHIANKDIRCNICKADFVSLRDFNVHGCSGSYCNDTVIQKLDNEEKNNIKMRREETPERIETVNKSEENDKKVKFTLAHNGQIILDNEEVLLTFINKVNGLVLINNDVTVVEEDEYVQAMGKGQDMLNDSPCISEIVTSLDLENLQAYPSQTGNGDFSRLIPSENYTEITIIKEDKSQEEKLLSENVIEDSNNIAKKWKCAKCDKEFLEKELYLQHLDIHFKNQNYKCQDCKKHFTWSSSLRNHILRKHTQKTEYSCEQCEKKYHSRLLVEHHVKRDHLNIRAHKCTICEKAFFRRYDLKVHIRIHTDERPYVCGVCGKRFRHLSHSIRHDKTHLKVRVRGTK